MEQTDIMEQTAPAERPQIPEPRYDPERASRRKVRVKKVPYSYDPMKEKTIFEFAGFVYICYAKKTRGRSMIRCLGMSQLEHEQKPVSPYDAGKILTKAEDDMGDAIKEAINDDVVQEVIKEVTGDGQSFRPDETPNP